MIDDPLLQNTAFVERRATKRITPPPELTWTCAEHAHTCCERRLYSIVIPGGELFVRVARDGARWKCPECGKVWKHVCGTPCGWEELL